MKFKQNKINPGDIERIFQAIESELELELVKFQKFPSDTINALSIINKKLERVVKDAIEWTYKSNKRVNERTLRIKIIQIIVMYVRILHGLETGDIKPFNIK